MDFLSRSGGGWAIKRRQDVLRGTFAAVLCLCRHILLLTGGLGRGAGVMISSEQSGESPHAADTSGFDMLLDRRAA